MSAHGYPAPEVFDAGEGWLVMERLDGTDMLAAMHKTPRGVTAAARQLAGLHTRLGAITAPDWMRVAPGPEGDRVVHLDLHPLNVMSTPGGLVVIDWANARRGDSASDVANTWTLLAAGEPPGGWFDRALVSVARGLLLRTFLGATDREAAKRALPAVVEWRVQDRNHTEAERRRIARLAG